MPKQNMLTRFKDGLSFIFPFITGENNHRAFEIRPDKLLKGAIFLGLIAMAPFCILYFILSWYTLAFILLGIMLSSYLCFLLFKYVNSPAGRLAFSIFTVIWIWVLNSIFPSGIAFYLLYFGAFMTPFLLFKVREEKLLFFLSLLVVVIVHLLDSIFEIKLGSYFSIPNSWQLVLRIAILINIYSIIYLYLMMFIQEQYIIRKNINNERNNLTSILESTIPSIVLDRYGRILYQNAESAKYTHLKKGEVLHYHGRHFFKKTEDFRIIAQVMDSGQRIRNFETELLIDKQTIYVMITSLPIQYQNQSAFLFTFIDISDKVQTEKALKAELRYKQHSINKAQVLQRSLNPLNAPNVKNYNLKAFYYPSEELGGDFFDIRVKNDILIVILADCMGLGIEASMHATLLKSIADRHLDLLFDKKAGVFMEAVNRDVFNYFEPDNFPVMFAAVIDTRKHTITYTSANHDMPFLIHNASALYLPKFTTTHLGFLEDSQYEQTEYTLNENDILFIHSDAFTEYRDGGSYKQRQQDLQTVLQKFGQGIDKDKDLLIEYYKEKNNWPLKDDATFLLIERLPEINREFTARDLDAVNQVQVDLETLLRRYNYRQAHHVILAYREMAINGIIHGNKNDPNKKIIIKMRLSTQLCQIHIIDEGPGFDNAKVHDPTNKLRMKNLLEEERTELLCHGRGIWMTRRLVNHLTYLGKGNEVLFFKEREEPLNEFSFHVRDRKYEEDKKIIDDNSNPWQGISQNHHSAKTNTLSKEKDHYEIDFSNTPLLSSVEIGDLLRLCLENKKKDSETIIMSNDENYHLLSSLNIDQITGVYLKKALPV